MQLLLGNKITTRGVVRPLKPEVYTPGKWCSSWFLDFGIQISQLLSHCRNFISVGHFRGLWLQAAGEDGK